MAGSEKYVSSELNYIEEGGNIWQIEEKQGKVKDRIKEGKFINKSLFFLTQVINCMNSKGESHIPYRNSPLTKILKSSLGGNTKTGVILCLSPTKSQFNHSLDTLKFGRSIRKVGNHVEKNVLKLTSENALALLINQYQARLTALDKGSESLSSSLKEENDMLWQQFIESKSPGTKKELEEGQTLIQFCVKECQIQCKNEPKENNKLIKTFIEALKLSCKHFLYWKTKAQQLEQKLNKSLELNNSLKSLIGNKDMLLNKLIEVAENCFNVVKSQTAKLEIFEYTEKWIQELSNRDLTALATHFKNKLEHIRVLISRKTPPKKSNPKLELKLKHTETYIRSLFEEAKPLSYLNNEQTLEGSDEEGKIVVDSNDKLIELIQSLKIYIQRKKNNNIEPLNRANSVTKRRRDNRSKVPTKIESRSTSANSQVKRNTVAIDKTAKSFELPDESTPSDQSSSGRTGPYAVGAFSTIQSFLQVKKNVRQRQKVVVDNDVDQGNAKELVKNKSPDGNRGGILQTWHRMMDSIGFK